MNACPGLPVSPSRWTVAHASTHSGIPSVRVMTDASGRSKRAGHAIRAILQKALDVAGMDPVVVADGQEAIERVRRERFDLVMCDHRMAGMYGTEVHDAIAEIRPELARRFVFMSGDVLNPELRAFAVDRHVGLLAKPFDIETVTRAVRQLLAEVELEGAATEPLG